MPVVREPFAKEDEVAWAESGDMIADAAGAAALGEERELHFQMVVPVGAFSGDSEAGVGGGDGVDLAERFTPAEQAEGVALWDLDDLFGAAHEMAFQLVLIFLQCETIVAGVETESVECVRTGCLNRFP